MGTRGRQNYDVVIIGAGPSGAVAAALLQRKFLSVLVLERQQFPRFSIGESLLPHCMDFLQQAGMLESVKQAGFQPKNGAAFRQGDDYESFDFGDKSCIGWDQTYQVERARFDKILADEAERQGVEIRYRNTITAFQSNGGTARLGVTGADGQAYEVDAGFVLDASGFGRVLARLLDLERPSGFIPRSSIFTHVSDHISADWYDRNKILVHVHPRQADIWYWMIPFSGGRASIGVIAPTDVLAEIPGDDQSRLRQLVAQVPDKAELLANAEYDSPVGSIEGYACDVSRLHGDNFALLGNAGEFLDPVFSSGVTIALKSASLAAETVARQLAGSQPDWNLEYAQPLKQGVDTFREFVGAWYDGRLQDIFFSNNKSEKVRGMICSVLAGYVWDADNPFVQKPARLNALAELCRAD
ncbi:MAG: NAD(P)/FAD-dependent oxidoreductase [Gammaproteobacteria bacterium]|nr:NAD(P)/FAD-dependent oxidoreductase [Gammaproteobacteria bacterium]